MYCDPEILRDLIRQAQESGVVSDRLICLVGMIAHGVWTKYHRWLDEDDFCQQVLLRFLGRYRDVDTDRPARQIFNWLTAVALNEGRLAYRYAGLERAKIHRFARHLGDQIPER